MSFELLLGEIVQKELVDLIPAVVELLLVLVVEVVLVPGHEVGAPPGEGETACAVTSLPHSPPPGTGRGQQNVLLLTVSTSSSILLKEDVRKLLGVNLAIEINTLICLLIDIY